MKYINYHISSKQRGFTLVELAMCLLVIGLLIGGVLKGHELIKNARIRGVAQEVTQIEVALRIFVERYGDLPGNIENPNFQLPNCTSTVCNARYGTSQALTTTQDRARFWLHLDRAGLITGVEEDGTTVRGPLNAIGGRFYTASTSIDSKTRSIIYISDKPNEFYMSPVTAELIDRLMDDGKPLSGEARMLTSPTGCVDTANNAFGTDKALRCQFFIHPNYINVFEIR